MKKKVTQNVEFREESGRFEVKERKANDGEIHRHCSLEMNQSSPPYLKPSLHFEEGDYMYIKYDTQYWRTLNFKPFVSRE